MSDDPYDEIDRMEDAIEELEYEEWLSSDEDHSGLDELLAEIEDELEKDDAEEKAEV